MKNIEGMKSIKKTIILSILMVGDLYAANIKAIDLKYAYSSSNQECLKIDSELRNILLDKDEDYTITNIQLISETPTSGKAMFIEAKTPTKTYPFTVFSKKGGCLLYKDISLNTYRGDFNNPKYRVE